MTITVSLASQGSIEKSLWTILRADICKLYPKVFLRAGIPNSRKQPQSSKSVVEKRARFAAPAKFSSHQTRTTSGDCLRLVTEVYLSVYMLSRKKIQHNKTTFFPSTKGTRALKHSTSSQPCTTVLYWYKTLGTYTCSGKHSQYSCEHLARRRLHCTIALDCIVYFDKYFWPLYLQWLFCKASHAW